VELAVELDILILCVDIGMYSMGLIKVVTIS